MRFRLYSFKIRRSSQIFIYFLMVKDSTLWKYFKDHLLFTFFEDCLFFRNTACRAQIFHLNSMDKKDLKIFLDFSFRVIKINSYSRIKMKILISSGMLAKKCTFRSFISLSLTFFYWDYIHYKFNFIVVRRIIRAKREFEIDIIK